MNAPSLADLRDIHLPPTPWPASALPEGEVLLALLAASLLAFAALVGWLLQHVARRRQRAALRELARLAAGHRRDGDATRLACGLSRLLRHHAAARFPAAGTAGLVGNAWLSFLDAHGGDGAFAAGVGAALASRPYRADGELDAAALIALVRRWLEANPA